MRRSTPNATESVVPPILNMVLITQNIGAADPFDVPKDQPADKTVVPDKIKDLWLRWAASCADMLAQEEERNGGEPIDVFVLHVQEIGGKGFSAPMIDFLNDTHRICYPTCGWSSGLLMSRDNDVKTFTALGSFIFLSPRTAACASILDFRHRTYRRIADVDGISNGRGSSNNNSSSSINAFTSHGGAMLGEELAASGDNPSAASASSAAAAAGAVSISATQLRRDICYPAKFVNADTSRKGFVLASLRVGRRVFNFMNLHLFHDADNAVAASVSPSPYVARRIEAFLEALSETACVVDEADPLFIFGDLNLRLDTHGLMNALKEQGMEPKVDKKKVSGDPAAWEAVTSPAKWMWMQGFDHEPTTLFAQALQEHGQRLHEAPVRFGPTYLVNENKTRAMSDAEVLAAAPFHRGCNQGPLDDEDEYSSQPVTSPSHRAVYQPHRFPAWCDRIFFNEAAAELFVETSKPRKQKSSASASAVKPKVYCDPLYSSAPVVHMDHLSVMLRTHVSML